MTSNDSISIRGENIVHYLEDNLFAIPDYQRGYSWRTPEAEKSGSLQVRYQVKEFWEDIINGYRNDRESGKTYYIGTIVLSSSKDPYNNYNNAGRLNVVDGQQRLVTLYLLYAALADWYYSKGKLAEKLAEDATKKVFEISKSVKRVFDERIVLPDDEGKQLKNLLEPLKDEKTVDISSLNAKSNIENAFKFFRESIQKFSESGNSSGKVEDSINLVAKLDAYMEKQLYVAVVKTVDAIRAHVVFETLNDRGIHLGAEDLIKNYLFSRAGDNYKDVIRLWKNIASHLASIDSNQVDSMTGVSRFDRFMQRYLISFEIPVEKRSRSFIIESDIFAHFKQWFNNKRSDEDNKYLNDEDFVKKVMEELNHASLVYTSLHSGRYWEDNIFKEKEPIGEYVPIIGLLECINGMEKKRIGKRNWYAPLYPLFFSALFCVEKRLAELENITNEKYRRKNYHSIIKDLRYFVHYIESYIFRSYMIHGQVIRTEKFVYLAQRIREGKYDNLVDIFNERIFHDFFSNKSSEIFREVMSDCFIFHTGRDREDVPFVQFVKYILRKLENKRQGDGYSELKVAEYGKEASLEHIFPLEYSKGKKDNGWEEFLDEKQGKYDTGYVFRMGNYTLLHGALNSEISNSPWNIKREYLKKSQIIHTAYIANTYDSWTPEVVDEVQRKLADEAVEVWNSPRGKKEAK